tara:strand:- start:96 stop:521 length:426 start_codon:yes stop_codon:yes gene_type:complete
MSKLGRYSADRKKVESITATKNLAVADCGTIFAITESGTAITLTLPTVADAGKGWWARFVMIADSGGSTDVTIAQNTSDTNDIVLATTCIDGANVTLAGDGFTFDVSASVPGDWGEIWTDGTKWYGIVFSSASAGIVQYDA